MSRKYANTSKSTILWVYVFICGILILSKIFNANEIANLIFVLIYALCYTLLPFDNIKMLKYILRTGKKYLFIKFLVSASFFFLILETMKHPKMLGDELGEIIFLVITIVIFFIYLLLFIDEKLFQLRQEVVK